MPKPEIEFIDCDLKYEWRPVEGDKYGIMEKILSHDPDTGDYTRLLKFPPGTETQETLVHDFWEEVWIVEGSLLEYRQGANVSCRLLCMSAAGNDSRTLQDTLRLRHLRAAVLQMRCPIQSIGRPSRRSAVRMSPADGCKGGCS